MKRKECSPTQRDEFLNQEATKPSPLLSSLSASASATPRHGPFAFFHLGSLTAAEALSGVRSCVCVRVWTSGVRRRGGLRD